MMKSYFLVILSFSCVISLPVDNTSQDVDLTEADMVLTDQQNKTLFTIPKHRNAIRNPAQRWPATINVYYEFDQQISKLL